MRQGDLFEDQPVTETGPQDAVEPLSAQALLVELDRWSEAGWLRRLDCALASFVARLCPATPPVVLLAAAALSALEGHGHSCIVIQEFATTPAGLLGWSGDAAVALEEAVQRVQAPPDRWLTTLQDCEAVWSEPSDPDRRQPLILSRGRLYLRRYWLHERKVAALVLERVAAHQAVDLGEARRWLSRLFPRTTTAQALDWQTVACAIALRGRLSIVTGGPGTGKTHTAARISALLFALDDAPEEGGWGAHVRTVVVLPHVPHPEGVVAPRGRRRRSPPAGCRGCSGTPPCSPARRGC